MSKIADAVAALAEPVLAALGLELWDAEYVKEAGTWFLRLYIDRAGGVTLDDCEAVSRAVDPLLDERESLFPEGYVFEVSSAGAERRLKRPGDFEKFIGHYAEIKLYQPKFGSRAHLGHLKAYNSGAVTLSVTDGEVTFEKSEIASARLRIE